jgi:hypothetical protein
VFRFQISETDDIKMIEDEFANMVFSTGSEDAIVAKTAGFCTMFLLRLLVRSTPINPSHISSGDTLESMILSRRGRISDSMMTCLDNALQKILAFKRGPALSLFMRLADSMPILCLSFLPRILLHPLSMKVFRRPVAFQFVHNIVNRLILSFPDHANILNCVAKFFPDAALELMRAVLTEKNKKVLPTIRILTRTVTLLRKSFGGGENASLLLKSSEVAKEAEEITSKTKGAGAVAIGLLKDAFKGYLIFFSKEFNFLYFCYPGKFECQELVKKQKHI